MTGPIVLTPRDVRVDHGALAEVRREFESQQCAILRGLLDEEMLELLRPRLASAWREFAHAGIGTEVVLEDAQARGMLHFAINAPAVIEAVRQLCDCPEVTWFDGRIFRMDPRAGHYDSWHDDFVEGRLVGMSVNLSFEGYEGGEFEIRHKKADTPLGRLANRVAGNASLFRLSPHLEHRVAPLAGTRPRTAFAGWFRKGEPDLLTRLRR